MGPKIGRGLCPSERQDTGWRICRTTRISSVNGSCSGDGPMTSRPVFLACLAALLAASALTAQQTGTVSGTVRAARDGAPLAGASVVIVGTARSVFTNALGQYHLSVPAGTGTIRARLIGYEAAEPRVMGESGEKDTEGIRLAAM